jgi:predicted dithiol-disulfide oxidoreductase (DUF899 family)
MSLPRIASYDEWYAASRDLVAREKELTRRRDALSAERRELPMVEVEDYTFAGPDGPVTLGDLFDGRRQLIVYRAFMDPGVEGWPEHGCSGCSLMADHVGNLSHLNARDTTLVYASRGSQQDIGRIKTRMGWTIPWYTILEESGVAFDVDFDVDQWHGTNAFIRDGDQIFRTYFVNNRGDEAFGTTWSYLDITALGRQESWEDSPAGYPQTPPYEWWRWHDAYGDRSAAGTEQGCDSCADR